MRYLILILFVSFLSSKAQDKIFMRDGTSQKGVILSIANDFVFFKYSDTSTASYKIPKSDIYMVEKYDGRVFIYGTKKTKKDTSNVKTGNFPLNYFGLQPLSFLAGRATFCYERLNKSGTVGFVLPLTLTYDPVGIIYQSSDSSFKRTPGVNFIVGADVNFYIGKDEHRGFYLGPRVRYGVDMFLPNIEAYSVQTQFGWCGKLPINGLYQHISFGFGFARILSSQAGNRINPKQSYGWGSVNYRVSFGH